MIWYARLKPLAAVAMVLILATAAVAVQGRQERAGQVNREQARAAPPVAAGPAPAAPELEANRALARQELALIEDAWAMLRKLARNDRLGIADPAFSVWGRRRLEMLRKAGAGKAEVIAALNQYIDQLKEDEAFASDLVQNARATQLTVSDVKYRRIEAEIWLNEEKAR